MNGLSDNERRTLPRLAAQLGRFGLVGVANTLVDLACTNLLFLLWKASSPVTLALISVVAGAIATAQSYLLNSRWTFGGAGSGAGTSLRFLAFALLGLVTQAAVTLCVAHWLLLGGGVASLAVLNVAKFAAVVAAAGVTFIGYRVAVFTPRGMAAFRDALQLSGSAVRPSAAMIAGLLALAVAVRVAFLWMAPVAYGDAIQYSWDAWLVAHGQSALADGFWHSVFDYWQALLVALGLGRFGSLVTASLVPGVLLVVPGYLLATRLYGREAGVIAGAALALHPRLVEYSVNGYAEMFFLNAALWATWGLTVLVREPGRWRVAVLAGAGLALWFLVRNEALLSALLLCATVAAAWWRGRRRPPFSTVLAVGVTAAVVVFACLAADVRFFGAPLLFTKGSNVSRTHVEMLDPHEAARETYAAPGTQATPVVHGRAEIAVNLLRRWPRNLAYTLERIPGVLLSPLFLLALLLPALCRRRAGAPGEEWPLLAFTVWPLVFYPMLQLEPRMLLPVAIGTLIFGAAALVAIGRFLAGRFERPRLRWIPAALVTGALLPLVPFVARHTLNERSFHRDVGAWIAANVPPDVAISGDGYGYVTASAFWADRRGQPRLWVETPAELAAWAHRDGPRIVVLYERYLHDSNPELISALDDGLPGLTLAKAFRFDGVGRVQIYATNAAATRVAAVERP